MSGNEALAYPQAIITETRFSKTRTRGLTCQVVVRCGVCEREHLHGVWDVGDPTPALGLRTRHCGRHAGPDDPWAYELTDPHNLLAELWHPTPGNTPTAPPRPRKAPAVSRALSDHGKAGRS